MAESGLLLGWDRVVPGRDVQAVALWREMGLYLKKLHAEGRIAGFESVMLGAYGGKLNGFLLIKGERHQLDAIRNSTEFQILVVRANKNLLGFCSLRAHMGGAFTKLLDLYATA